MIHIPNDYDSAQAYNGQFAPVLPIGGHICKILKAEMRMSSNGNEILCIAFDIADAGEYKDFYRAVFDRKVKYNAEAKWPGMFRAGILNREGKTSGYFKGFITSVEESNVGYNFRATNGDENTLVGKLVGFNFGEEEWRKSDGTVGVSVKPFYAVSIQTVRDGIEPPPRKVLNDQQAQMEKRGFTPVEDVTDDLPF